MTLSAPHKKTSLRHRLAATAIAVTVLALNAPISLVGASETPQTELAGEHIPQPPTPPHVKVEKEFHITNGDTQTHVIRSRTDKNGVVLDRKVEITVDGDTVTAFEIDPVSGTRTQINPETIDGYERITQTRGHFKIDNENGQIIRFEELDDKISKIIQLKMDGHHFDKDKDIAALLEEYDIDIDEDDINAMKVVKLGDIDRHVVFAGNYSHQFDTTARLQAASSLLESAESMLAETEEASREVEKAQKKLEEALKAVETALAKSEAEK